MKVEFPVLTFQLSTTIDQSGQNGLARCIDNFADGMIFQLLFPHRHKPLFSRATGIFNGGLPVPSMSGAAPHHQSSNSPLDFWLSTIVVQVSLVRSQCFAQFLDSVNHSQRC